jgi:hypothetical protein
MVEDADDDLVLSETDILPSGPRGSAKLLATIDDWGISFDQQRHWFAQSWFPAAGSPVPLLSIRNMVEVDFAFLNRTYDPAPLRVRFLRSYLHYVGRELGYLSRSKVEAALQQAEEQARQPA